MRTLAIDCATEACSIALFDGEQLIAHEHRVLGRGHAERLVPMIAELPDKGRANRILVSRGPGSFTGVRIGIAAARALAVAWKCEIAGYPTLALVAAIARAERGAQTVSVAMAGGHGELFVQNFSETGAPEAPHASLPPEAAASFCKHHLVAGTRAEMLVDTRGTGTAAQFHPNARHVLAMPQAVLTSETSPIYGRAPDAKPMATPAVKPSI